MSGEASAIYDTLDTHTDIEDVKRIARNWMDSAAQHLRNEEYYRGVCHEIGETLFGREAHIQDDGGYSENVLVAKLPGLAKAAAGPIEAAKIEEIAIKCARHELDNWENNSENLDDIVVRACTETARQALRSRAAGRSRISEK